MNGEDSDQWLAAITRGLRQGISEENKLSAIDRRGYPSLTMFFVVSLIVAGGFIFTNFEMRFSISGGVASFAVLFLGGVALRRVGHGTIGSALQCIAALGLFTFPIIFASSMLAAINLPLQDEALIAADRLLGFDWLNLYRWARDDPDLLRWLSIAYRSIIWQPPLLLILLFAFNMADEAWRVTTAWLMALIAVILISPIVPAVGAVLHYGVPPTDLVGMTSRTSWSYYEVFGALRSGELRTLGPETLVGTVVFPSFHVTASLLLGWGFYRLRWLRWPFVALNIAQALSSLVVGAHYLVDVLAGAAIGIAALVFARRALNWSCSDPRRAHRTRA